MSKPEVGVSETLKKAQDWELEIWSEESGYDYVEIFLDDVVDIIDSIKYLKQQNKRYRELIKELHLLSNSEESIRNIVREVFYKTGVSLYGESEFVKTFKELEEAIYILNDYKKGTWTKQDDLFNSIDTVVQQAEKVQELDKKNSDYWLENDTLHKSVRYLQQQNKCYREAIEKALKVYREETTEIPWKMKMYLLEGLEVNQND